MARAKEITKTSGSNTLRFKCDECDGKYLDTRVEFNGTLICWCTFSEAEEFAEEFFAVIEKYRI